MRLGNRGSPRMGLTNAEKQARWRARRQAEREQLLKEVAYLRRRLAALEKAAEARRETQPAKKSRAGANSIA